MKQIRSSEINGKITAPHSKSVFQRTVFASVLANGTTRLFHQTLCQDDHAALNIAKCLNAKIVEKDDHILINGPARPKDSVINCGESGLSIRMASAVSSLFDTEITLIAEGLLKNRPMDMIVEPLISLGAVCSTTNGLAPIKIKGPINGRSIEVDGRTSSQFLSGLLTALPVCKSDSEIFVKELKSKPYIMLTIDTLKKFNINIEFDDDLGHFIIKGKQIYQPADITIEGDWSGASFILTAGAIKGRVTVKGLNLHSYQADIRIMEAIKAFGAVITENPDSIEVIHKNNKAFDFDATDCPDLFPPLLVLALNSDGLCRINGVTRLFHKESNRAKSLSEEFIKLGGKISIKDDLMIIEGSKLHGADVFSHNDHRIAMALSVAGIMTNDPVIIKDTECIKKSYPDFYPDMTKIGVKIS